MFRKGVCGCLNNDRIGEGKGSEGARKGVTGAGRANIVVANAASGDGVTGMLESTAKGDGELEGTAHELSAFDISLESVSCY